jgi:hypothetical protein
MALRGVRPVHRKVSFVSLSGNWVHWTIQSRDNASICAASATHSRGSEGIGGDQTGAYLTEDKRGEKPPDVLSVAFNPQTHPISAS